MELIFLGTSAGRPTKERNVSSIVLNLMPERNTLWLFDCGEATQHQLMKTDLSLARLEMIFITHLHGDHLFGLPGVLTSRSLMENMKPLILFGPKGIRQFVETVIDISHSWLTYPLTIIEIEQDGLIFEDEKFIVETKALDHRITVFGYRITEKDRSGALNIDRLESDNIPIGANYAKFKKGETVVLDDGRIINGAAYLSPTIPGKKIAILGDTIPTLASITLAKDVDVLVHEATQEAALEDKANMRGHSTTTQAAEIAKQSKAKKLVITHISPRYRLKDNQRLVSECQQIFQNTDIATDLAIFKI